ncbi:PilN domain-containing protein [Pseudomonadota bacterium]
MAHINLLPWRETLRKKRQQQFGLAAAGMIAVTVLLLLGAHLQIQGMIDYQGKRNKYLTNEIADLDRKIAEIKALEKTKAQLLTRMEIIQQLQSSRPEIVRLFDELVKTLPEGTFLTKVIQRGRGVNLDGRAQSNARVSSYMRKIDASDWMGNPRLVVIEAKDKTGTGFSHFQMSASQVTKKPSEGGGK